MDIDPARGLGRALFAALDQFAASTSLPELKTAPVVPMGFSGARAFAARLVGFAPTRIAAAILANAGQFEPLGLDRIEPSGLSLTVPEFILSGGSDKNFGTERAYSYFSRSWNNGAPWLFVIQNNVPHCCALNAKELILGWLDSILRQRLSRANGPLAAVRRNAGFDAFFRLVPTAIRDTWNLAVSNAEDPRFRHASQSLHSGEMAAGWLPSRQLARQWQHFVALPSHPVASMP